MKKQLLVLALLGLQTGTTVAEVKSALDMPYLGLYATGQFRLTDGRCGDCPVIPQAKWYFQKDSIAVANKAENVAGFSTTENAQADVSHWIGSAKTAELAALPPLIWMGSTQVIASAKLSPDHSELSTQDGQTLAFNIVPKLSTNRSYLNDSSWNFFAQRSVKLRGELNGQQFVARTVWPLDYKLDQSLPLKPLQTGESLKQLVEADNGGAKSAFSGRVLWSRDNKADWQNMAVVGLMLNGAQGDDDEAHGGHFGVVTGRYSADGDWSQWLVNNIYNLDAFSEKGIVAAVTPMDKYLMDLNSGQSYYRPSYMLVALMKQDRVASQYQSAINRVYNHFYRHDFVYDHSQANCSGVNVDTFHSIGWNIPTRGSEGQLKAIAAYFYVAATSRSLQDARKLYDYLTTETTRLYPAVAFDAMGEDLLALAQNKLSRPLSLYEKEVAQDIEAIVFVRIPQIPSSRVFGLSPIYSFDQYLKAAPADRSQWQIVPTEPRPFPDSLRTGLALEHSEKFPVPVPVTITALIILGICVAMFRWLKQRWRRQLSTAPLAE